MKINEILLKEAVTSYTNLVTALELLRNRYKDSSGPAVISTESLINMIVNTDRTFDYSSLVAAHKDDPAVKNLIKSFNKDHVVLDMGDSDTGETTTSEPGAADSVENPTDTVGDMAKRAAKQRGAAL